MTLSIDEMWAYIAVGAEGEGVTAMMSESGWIPLVGADGERMASYMDYAQGLADASGQPIVLARFTQREDITVIRPTTAVENLAPTVNIGTGKNEATGEQVANPLTPPKPGGTFELYDPDEKFPFDEQPN